MMFSVPPKNLQIFFTARCSKCYAMVGSQFHSCIVARLPASQKELTLSWTSRRPSVEFSVKISVVKHLRAQFVCVKKKKHIHLIKLVLEKSTEYPYHLSQKVRSKTRNPAGLHLTGLWETAYISKGDRCDVKNFPEVCQLLKANPKLLKPVFCGRFTTNWWLKLLYSKKNASKKGNLRGATTQTNGSTRNRFTSARPSSRFGPNRAHPRRSNLFFASTLRETVALMKMTPHVSSTSNIMIFQCQIDFNLPMIFNFSQWSLFNKTPNSEKKNEKLSSGFHR